jgi:hypothetical protein
MIENRTWHTAATTYGFGIGIGTDEPSHIHLPRRRRAVRPADQGDSVMGDVDVGNDERRGHAHPVADEA